MQYIVAPIPPERGRGDVFWTLSKEDTPKVGYFDKDMAIQDAKNLSQRNPGKEYGVFALQDVFETRRIPVPPPIHKQVTENGEIVPAAPVA